MVFHQGFPNPLCGWHGLVLLARLQHNLHGMIAAEPTLCFGKPKHGDVLIRKDEDLRGLGKRFLQFFEGHFVGFGLQK